MDNEPKIDLAKVYAMKLLQALKEFGADDYDYLIRQLRSYRTEIEKELAARDKSYIRIDEDYPIRTFVERVQSLQRSVPNILTNTVEGKFDDPKEIKEL